MSPNAVYFPPTIYNLIGLPFTMDEKAASSIAFGVHDLTDPHATDPASFLWEPSPAGVISGHNHSLDTHNIAVTKTTTTRRMRSQDNMLKEHYSHLGVLKSLSGCEAEMRHHAGGAPGGKCPLE